MRYQGINLENVKLKNQSAVLRILNDRGAMSRKDIAEAMGLTAASVTMICTELLEAGMILELGEAEGERKAGRKKILIDLNRQYKKVLCIGIEADETYLSLTDLKGEVLASDRMPTDRDADPEKFLKLAASVCKKLMKDKKVKEKDLLGAGVTMPGKVDREAGISYNTYSIWNREVPVKQIMEKELQTRVVVENNLKAYAESEILLGYGRTHDDFLLVKWGPGVGSAMILDQKVYQGASGLAGEIGHMPVKGSNRPCNCGRKGCLETEISTHSLMRDLRDTLGPAEDETGTRIKKKKQQSGEADTLKEWIAAGNRMTYRNTAEWAALPDPVVQKVMEEKIDLMCRCIRNAVSILDPDRIIVSGYLFEVPGLFEKIRGQYGRYDPDKDGEFILQSDLPQRDNHTEALAVVLEEFFF